MQAHQADEPARIAAQRELLPRYCAPVYHYLRGLVHDDAVAEELCQEFALRFLRGDFRHADRERGRFRDYLKASLIHLAGEHLRRKHTEGRLPPEATDRFPNSVAAAGDEDDRRFQELWQAELLGRTWSALEELSAAHSDFFFEVLRLKSEDPSRTAAALAEQLSIRYDRSFTPDGVRQTLRRARLRFAELLRAEVAASIPTGEAGAIDAELAELGLLVYCPPTT